MAAGFANQAALAIELAEARAEQQRVAMLDERDRIAADLHDHVIQRLFAAGLGLQSTAAALGPGASTDRILATVDDGLHRAPHPPDPGGGVEAGRLILRPRAAGARRPARHAYAKWPGRIRESWLR